jgi:tetratricopeptide (TPR) repeat protein
MSRVAKLGKQAFEVVEGQALALAALGRFDEADERYKRLLALGIEAHPDLIGVAVNRGHVLLHAGRPQEALKAVARVDALGDRATSRYGKMWNWSAKSCALAELGRKAEADAASKLVQDNRSENPPAYLLTMLCNDRLNDAEQAVLERLADPEQREAMLRALQNYEVAGDTGFVARMFDRLAIVRDRSSVRKAIDKVGRIIPVAGRRAYWGSF